MARLPRLSLPGHVHHVLQRGNNQQAIANGPDDYHRLLELLVQNSGRFEVALHAYVLMPNHFHVLVSPANADGLPLMMQAIGRSYVRYFNDAHHRSGTLWDGRYRSAPIQADPYLLACMVHMDLNPVRAGLVSSPQDYPWSSHHHYVGRQFDRGITPHALFWDLGNTPFAREAAYAELVQAGVSAVHHRALNDAALGGWALGDEAFLSDIQKATPRRVTKGEAGRPPNPPKKASI
jgi:putative transposase